MSRKVWGFLIEAGVTAAVYYVHWTLGRLDHGANVDLIIGRWGSQSTSADRSVALLDAVSASGLKLRVSIDAA
jgi:hypothetical protein